ncbi:MutS-related protein [Marinifilum sp. RC60d5]|uniref:MutS-related protein n=1 Tax=Marinifilum sp. RC60d5 TaxID=3458414 RepID=UPI0040359B81
MIFKKNEKQRQRLLNAFGKIKDTTYNFELIKTYFQNKNHSNCLQVLSEKTCNDIDFEELMMFVDRTNSKPGQQFLYNKLRVIPDNSDNLVLEEELISQFTNDVDFRIKIQVLLEKLNQREAYYIRALFQEQTLKLPKWFGVMQMLSFASIFSLILLPFNPQLAFVLLLIFVINICFHLWNKRNLSQYIDSIPQLLILFDVAKKLYQYKELSCLNSDLPDAFKSMDKIKNRMRFFKLDSNIQGDFQVIFWSILELFKILFLIEPLLLFAVIKRLETKRKDIDAIFSFVGNIDSLISIASLRKGCRPCCIPKIDELNNVIDTEKIYHPLIVDCVANNIKVNDKSILLTGSNMSGKTTFIRTIGINILTGQTLNTCFADSIIIPRTRIYSAIRISDDLMNDKSYYFEEVLSIKEMIDKASDNNINLFLLDEIFKGTNTVERISAGKSVLSALAKNNNIVFVSTHDIELTDLLQQEYELYHFSELVNNKYVDFDYLLKEGKLKNRNAIKILQINNYPDELIKEALALSKEMDSKLENYFVN